MRGATREEAAAWQKLAAKHGLMGADGKLEPGRFTVSSESRNKKTFTFTFVTPLRAREWTEDLRRKTPPIMFDRTDDGRLILPARWWQDVWEMLAEDERLPERQRRTTHAMAHGGVHVGDIYLPANVDTIALGVTDDDGNLVPVEALPPGAAITFHIARQKRKS